jgi:hypothetical protein
MRRRDFIGTGLGALGAAAFAGCTGGDDTGSEATPTPDGDGLPDGIYVQSFKEGMSMQGMSEADDYKVAVMYTAPHQFWRMIGDEPKEETITESDSVHLMALIWDPETRTVIPETGLSVAISKDGDSFDEQVIYPMLSQTMGFHYGANFALDGDGEYTVRVDIGGLNIRRTGDFEGQFDEAASTTVDIMFDEETRQSIEFRELDSHGQPGAVEPMEMMDMPLGIAPSETGMPGDVIGSQLSDDATLLATALRDDPPVGDNEYLAISARTRYNRYLLPLSGLDARLERDGETVFEDTLERTVDPELKYHYGAPADSIQAGDELTVSTVTPPQVARHEGYERAFIEMDDVTYTI